MRKHPHCGINTRVPIVKMVKDNTHGMGLVEAKVLSGYIETVSRFELRKENTKRFKKNKYFRGLNG